MPPTGVTNRHAGDAATNSLQIDPRGKKIMEAMHELVVMRDEFAVGNERECLELIDLAEKLRQKWLSATNENIGLKTMVSEYQQDVAAHKKTERTLREQLTDARAQVASLLSQKHACEQDRDRLEQQIDLVKELLHDQFQLLPEPKHRQLRFLDEPSRSVSRVTGDPRGGKQRRAMQSMSLLGEAEDDQSIDYDRTGDSLDDVNERDAHANDSGNRRRRHHKRSRSVPQPVDGGARRDGSQPSRKRSKETDHAPLQSTPCSPPTNLVPPTQIGRRSINRSFSETHLTTEQVTPAAAPKFRMTPGRSVADLRTPSRTPLRSWAAGTPLHSRQHVFEQRMTLKPEYCDVCSKRIMFGKQALKCQDCRHTCHVECRSIAPLPCVPRQLTPQISTRGNKQAPRLMDFTPAAPPMIPYILIHCMTELERRGLDMVGIYRIPGSESQVQNLLSQFYTQRGTPNLRALDDPAAITGCIKKFLSQLRDPLIPTSSWHQFVDAAEVNQTIADLNESDPSRCFDQLHTAIKELPMPHRDTLAFLCLHLQRVAMCADENRMPLENLAKVLAPTVVGYSARVRDGGVTPQAAMDEMPLQIKVLSVLLSLPGQYWNQFINFEHESVPLLLDQAKSPNTPELLHNTLLGKSQFG